MSNLEVYDLYGFKFFPCKHDKSPATKGDWKLSSNHIDKEKAEELQRTGQMIGAWIPENVIVIDLDKHEGKRSGYTVFNEIFKKYNINMAPGDTFAVKTAGGGMHLFFTTDKQFRQNSKDESVDLRTHKGYVIAAGSPGYKIDWENEIMPLPFEIEQWLNDCENESEKRGANKDIEKNGNSELTNNGNGGVKKLSVQNLQKILEKIPATNFRSNDKWIEFIFSVVATCGESEEVYQALTDWSSTDPAYSKEERNVARRIRATAESGGITSGTFIYYLREQNISEAIINKVSKTIAISEVLTVSENRENNLPFSEPDYYELAESASAAEFFSFPGAHSAAASILEKALKGIVLFVYSEEGKSFYFDGNKWQELSDIYSVVYTILYRTIKIYYAELPQGKENNENLLKCVKSFNNKTFKEQTWQEFTTREGIYFDCIDWDSPELAETMTCKDGVIDFRNYTKIRRQGLPYEFRRSYVDSTVDEILNSQPPDRFKKLLTEIFPDEDTCLMSKMLLGLSVSGNASKRIFQLWNGSGRNGKSLLVELMQFYLGDGKAYKFGTELIIEQKNKSEQYDQINFMGKYFCYASEVSKYQKLNIERIKELTGYETINARQIFQKRQNFRPTWQVAFISNDLPEFSADFAIVDRIYILPFEVRFYMNEAEKEKFLQREMINPDMVKPGIEGFILKPELLKEKNGVLNYFIDCYIELQTKFKGIIPVSSRSLVKKQKYVDDNDETSIFIKEFCFIDLSDEEIFVTTEEIAECYREFVGKSKLSDRVIIKDIMEFEPRIQKTSRMIDEENKEWSKDYNTYIIKTVKKQKRGLKYIGLLTDEKIHKKFKDRENQNKEFEQLSKVF